jgi:hypothetical protein
MSVSIKGLASAAVVALFAFAVCRAAMFRFQEKEREIRQACRDEVQKLGVPRDALRSKYPTPEIHLVSSGCLLPGGTGDVVIKGKFAPATRFVFQNDSLEVVKESLAGNQYQATVRVAPGTGPQTATVLAISPVTCITAQSVNALKVGGRFEWTVESANGWRIVASPAGAQPCGGEARSAEIPYEVLFYRKAETAPFEKCSAKLSFSPYEKLPYRFSISQQSGAGGTQMQEAQSLMQKMADPKLSPAEREQLMTRLQNMQQQLQAEMAKMADPAYTKQLEAKRLEFGCRSMQLAAGGTGLSGDLTCSPKVGTRIGVTGSMKFLGR